jgi:hypothetical protein
MGNNAKSYAYIRPDGKVQTFLRLDLPPTWSPEPGYSILPDDELPQGWEKYEEPVLVPQTISARQIRLWLIKNNIPLTSIDSAIDSINDQMVKDSIRVEWEYAPYVERNHPWINNIGSLLGLTSEQIDQAFIEASQL